MFWSFYHILEEKYKIDLATLKEIQLKMLNRNPNAFYAFATTVTFVLTPPYSSKRTKLSKFDAANRKNCNF